MATTLTRPTTSANQHPAIWCCRYQGLQCVKNSISNFSSGSSQLPFAVGIHKARSLGLFFGPKIPKFLSWFWNDLPDNSEQQQLLLWAQNLLQHHCPWPRPSKHLWQGNVLWPVGILHLFLSVCFCFWHFPTIENLGRPSYFLAMHNSAGRWIFIPPTNNCPTSKFTPFIAKWQNPKKTKKRRIFLKWKTVLKGYQSKSKVAAGSKQNLKADIFRSVNFCHDQLPSSAFFSFGNTLHLSFIPGPDATAPGCGFQARYAAGARLDQSFVSLANTDKNSLRFTFFARERSASIVSPGGETGRFPRREAGKFKATSWRKVAWLWGGRSWTFWGERNNYKGGIVLKIILHL